MVTLSYMKWLMVKTLLKETPSRRICSRRDTQTDVFWCIHTPMSTSATCPAASTSTNPLIRVHEMCYLRIPLRQSPEYEVLEHTLENYKFD